MNQLIQGLTYEQKSALIKELSKDMYYPTVSVHLLKNLPTLQLNAFFLVLAQMDPLAASRILAHWPEGTNAVSAIFEMFKTLYLINKNAALKVLAALDADPVRSYFANALRQYCGI